MSGLEWLFLLLIFTVPAFVGFITVLAFVGVWRGLAINVALALLGYLISPWIFWIWFLLLSVVGLIMAWVTVSNGLRGI